MNITTTSLFSYNNQPYMVLKRYEFDTSELPLEAAHQELKQKITESQDASQTWGYFPEIPDVFGYPASKALAASVREKLVSHDSQIQNYPVDLAFVRLAINEPQSAYGGFHVDVSPGIAHEWTRGVDPDSNILRVLFNVHDQPRKLEFYPYDIEQLVKEGYVISSEKYKVLDFPDLATRTIEIPPIEPNAVYAVQFLSNHIPHAGRTYAEGHFLVSFGGYIPPHTNPFAATDSGRLLAK